MKNQVVRVFKALFMAGLLVVGVSGGFMGNAFAADSGQVASPVIYSVSISPAKAAVGDAIQMEAIFSVFDETDRASLPVKYCYEIKSVDGVIFKSPLKTMNAVNGAKSHLGMNIQAAGDKGRYTMVLTLVQQGRTAVATADFSIVSLMEARQYRSEMSENNPSADTPENRLPGQWEFRGQTPDEPARRLTISKEDGELTARIAKENAEALWVKIRKTEKRLVIRSKMAESGGGCWYVMEDVISFNDGMTDMPVRSKVLEGSGCVPVGRTSQSVLHRLE